MRLSVHQPIHLNCTERNLPQPLDVPLCRRARLALGKLAPECTLKISACTLKMSTCTRKTGACTLKKLSSDSSPELQPKLRKVFDFFRGDVSSPSAGAEASGAETRLLAFADASGSFLRSTHNMPWRGAGRDELRPGAAPCCTLRTTLPAAIIFYSMQGGYYHPHTLLGRRGGMKV